MVKREKEGHTNMDPVATAIIGALSAGAVGGLTEASKTAISDAYSALTSLLQKKFGSKSEVVQAVTQLEAKPESANRQEMLQEQLLTVKAEQDSEVLSVAESLLKLVHFQTNLSLLHPAIFSKCKSLFETGAYAEAVEKSFKVVRDRLRFLTTYETGSEAFGIRKGNLHIKGAAAPNVDKDFNEAVKFLTMSIDKFRNEKSHTSDAKISEPQRAYEYLCISSLAMHLLEGAEIRLQ